MQELRIIKTVLEEIADLRTQFLHEHYFQFVYNKCHDYGWADTYLFTMHGRNIGYGAVWGTDRREDRDAIFEFYLVPPYRRFASSIFPEFHAATRAAYIECQSNEPLLSSMLYEHARNIKAEAILFEDHITTTHTLPDVIFRRKKEGDKMGDDDSSHVLELHGGIVANGGLMLNYNLPYADIYMQVKEPYRRQGLGSFLVQELKKEAYHMGRVPAARCNIHNQASKATLMKAGLKVCGFMLKGDIRIHKL